MAACLTAVSETWGSNLTPCSCLLQQTLWYVALCTVFTPLLPTLTQLSTQKWFFLGWVIIVNGNVGCGWQQPTCRLTASQLAWFEGWLPPGTESAFTNWTRTTLVMTPWTLTLTLLLILHTMTKTLCGVSHVMKFSQEHTYLWMEGHRGCVWSVHSEGPS